MTTDGLDSAARLSIEFIRVLRCVIELGVKESPEAAVSMVGEYFEDANAAEDDPELRALLDAWWELERKREPTAAVRL